MLVKWQKNKTMTVEIDALGQKIPNVQVLPHCAVVQAEKSKSCKMKDKG